MATSQQIVNWLQQQDSIRFGESPWRTVTENEDVHLVDWKRLFPSQRPDDRGQNDWDVFGDEWEFGFETGANDESTQFVTRIRNALDEQRPTDEKGTDFAEGLNWDTCAWYQPMHFFGHDWGIFIRQSGVWDHAIQVARFMPPGTAFSSSLLKALVRAGFAALFLHEQFHHKVESLGIRLHVVERKSRYLPYVQSVYRPTYLTDDNLEEALANADAYLRLQTSPYSTWMGKNVVNALQQFLRWRLPLDPPGYRKAMNYLTNAKLNRGVDRLHGQVQEALLKPTRASDEWEVATRLHQSLFKVTDHLWEVVPRGSTRPVLPGAAPYPSVSSRQMIKLAEKYGWSVKEGAGKGSHVRLERSGKPPLTIPGNRRDVSPGVANSVLKAINPSFRLNDLPMLLPKS